MGTAPPFINNMDQRAFLQRSAIPASRRDRPGKEVSQSWV
ncbi:hypothetical protein HMPREF1545_03725 [Oscillibacter sp. KLE 1728]|nr:hypothetical protein HMPREF1545_03725 [Oscillibacter sp. KLE 1728]ERK67648.1 hypothetical protein HMPREF1546_00355 [Oscillibacter sp. KLE 1745]